ncbi:MAG: hypothetical protein PHX83_11410 [Acidobacteriia bacterium]|nr:hypothetical protein [Terriglobia bacterium]
MIAYGFWISSLDSRRSALLVIQNLPVERSARRAFGAARRNFVDSIALMRVLIGKFTKIFVAVIGGNALYYIFEDNLPAVFRHRIFALDWGLLLDLWICILCWLLLDFSSKLIQRRRR